MLPKANRITKTKEFERIFQEGMTVRGRGLLVKVCSNQLENSRFGIVVSKKVAKHATDRNRIRRLISEAVRKNAEQLKPGWDVAVIVLPGFALASEGEVAEALFSLFKKARVAHSSSK